MKTISSERTFCKSRLGSSTTEILLVVLIMLLAVCLLIPPVRVALIKGREASDVANIRAAYVQFQYTYITEGVSVLPNRKTQAEEFVKELLGKDGEPELFYIVTKRHKYGISQYFVPETETYYITYTPRYLNGGEAYEWAISGENVQFLKDAP